MRRTAVRVATDAERQVLFAHSQLPDLKTAPPTPLRLPNWVIRLLERPWVHLGIGILILLLDLITGPIQIRDSELEGDAGNAGQAK